MKKTTTVLIKNLPKTITESEIQKRLKSKFTFKKTENDKKKFCGAGILEFEDEEKAFSCVRKNKNLKISGKKIFLDFYFPGDEQKNLKNKNRKEKDETEKAAVKEKTQTEQKTPKTGKQNKIEKRETLLVSNLFYKETAKTLREKLEKYGEIEKVSFEKTVEKFAKGNATVTFKNYSPKIFSDEIHSFSKIIHIRSEKIKSKGKENSTRLILKNIKKNLKKDQIENFLQENELKVEVNFKAGEKGRNMGYCFLQFKNEKEADDFSKNSKKYSEFFGNYLVQKSIDKKNY